MPFLYKNNGSKKQLLCKICNATFLPDEGRFSAAKLQCPHCGRTLTPKNASSLKFSKHSTHIMSLCLTMQVNLGLSLRKTAHVLKELYNVTISHQQVANYCKTAAICIKPYVDQYPYEKNDVFTADETYIKIRGVKSYIWLIINAATRSILGYQVPDNRGVGP